MAEFEDFNDGDAPAIPMFGTFVRNCVYKPLMPLTTRGQLPMRQTLSYTKIRLTNELSIIYLSEDGLALSDKCTRQRGPSTNAG